MEAIAGCSSCGHIEGTEPEATAGKQAGTCPRCGRPLRALGPLGSRLLAVYSARVKSRKPLREPSQVPKL